MFPAISDAQPAWTSEEPEVSEGSGSELEDELSPEVEEPSAAPKRRTRRRKNKQFKLVTNPRQHQSFAGEPKAPSFDKMFRKNKPGQLSTSVSAPSIALTPAPSESLTPRFDIDVSKTVLHREGLCRSARDKSQYLIALARAGKPLDDTVKGLLDHLLVLRDTSADVVEGIVAWRRHKALKTTGIMGTFVWNGIDYLHKLCNDLDFLASCEPLVAALRLSPAILRANPFMLPSNLADRAVLLAQSPAYAVDAMPLLDAERVLLSTSLLPAVRSIVTSLPPSASQDGGDAARLAKRAEERLKAAEVVTLHHLATKAGDSGLGNKLDRPSVADPLGSDLTSEPTVSTRVPLGMNPSDPLISNRSPVAVERSADGDDVVVSGGGEARLSVEFDALALTESMHAADLQQQSLVKGKSSSTTVGQDAKPYQPKGLAHSVRKASAIYSDTSDIQAAARRRESARAAAAAVAPPNSSLILSSGPSSDPKPAVSSKSTSQPRHSVERTHDSGRGSSVDKPKPSTKPPKSVPKHAEDVDAKKATPKKPKKPKKKPAQAGFDPTGLTDKSVAGIGAGPSNDDVPDTTADAAELPTDSVSEQASVESHHVHRRAQSIDGTMLLLTGTLHGDGMASVTALDPRTGLSGSVDVPAFDDNSLDEAMGSVHLAGPSEDGLNLIV